MKDPLPFELLLVRSLDSIVRAIWEIDPKQAQLLAPRTNLLRLKLIDTYGDHLRKHINVSTKGGDLCILLLLYL